MREAAWGPPGFDARRWAQSRTYRYLILSSEWPNPLIAATTWHVGQTLDVRRMEAACDVLLGEHDFSSFCRALRDPGARDRLGPPVRRVLRASWSDLGCSRLCFEIEAASFCHQMVRSIVGTLVEVGTGRRKAGELSSVLAARNRAAAGPGPAARPLPVGGQVPRRGLRVGFLNPFHRRKPAATGPAGCRVSGCAGRHWLASTHQPG